MTSEKEKIFDFLFKLQISGSVNMNFAAPNLIERFDMTEIEAKQWLGDWKMSTMKPYCEDCEE